MSDRHYILIIGAMKCGTTTLFEQLALDPRVAGAHPKEPGFFAFEEVYAQGWDWYERQFGFDPAQHVYALDGSTDYAKHPFVQGVPERLRAAGAERFKLIYVLRDPIERLESHARHTQLCRMEVGRALSPRPDHSLDAGISPVNLAVSDYAAQLDVWREWYERGALLALTTDRLKHDGQGVMDDLSAFLGLPGLQWRPQAKRANAKDAQRAEHPLLRSLKQNDLVRETGKRLLPKAVRTAINERAVKNLEAHGRFELTDAERRDLAERLAPSLDRLTKDFGVEVPEAWKAHGVLSASGPQQ